MTKPIRIELPTLFGMKTVNSYLFKDPEPVLIDCGEKSEGSWNALNAALKENGLTIKDISRVIITHPHIDHMGMAGKITENSDAQVWVNDYSYEWAVDLDEAYRKRNGIIKKVIGANSDPSNEAITANFTKVFGRFHEHWDNIDRERVTRFSIGDQLELGGSNWEVLHAPGHCIQQTCFYQKESLQLISADMLLKITPTPVIDTTIEPPYERVKSLAMLLDSLERFAQLDIDQIYPGHYEVFSGHKTLIDYQIKRINSRKEECYQLIANGIHHLFDLLNELYKGRISMPAIPMLIGYLDLLQDENRIVAQTDEKGVISYHKI